MNSIKYYVLSIKGSTRLLLFLLLVTCNLSLVTFVHAQTPSSWQQNATGLKTQTNTEKKTGGLTFNVADKGWPFLILPGGVQDSGYGKNTGPIGIEMGLIKNNPAITSVFSSETTDWAHNEMTFNSGTPNQLKVTASRLTPALLLDNATNNLRLFAGNVFTFKDFASTGLAKAYAPALPKYVAYSSGGTIQVKTLSSSSLPLPELDNNWLLVWYGTNSPFFESTQPNPYPFPALVGCCRDLTGTISKSSSYQADSPELLVFKNSPSSISQSPEGGIDLQFAASSEFTSVIPIFGRAYPKASDTESWGSSLTLPALATSRINFWTARACQYPQSVSESYGYNPTTDTATFTDNITFIPVCSFSSTKFAQISSMLGIAKNSFGSSLTFSSSLVDANLPTEFGPTIGVDNTNSYSWSLSGINKYLTYPNTSFTMGNVPASVMNSLKSEVDKITAAGHYSPWYIADRMSHSVEMGVLYFINPAEAVTILSQIIPILPEPQKTNLTNYLKSERSTYAPETIFNLTPGQGTIRGDFNPPDQSGIPGSPSQLYLRWQVTKPDQFMKRVWLYNFYSLANYYNLTGEAIPASVLSAGLSTLDKDFAERDFASMHWFKGFEDRRVAVVNANREIAGLIGLSRIANKLGDTTSANLTNALLAKSIAMRIGMAKLPVYRSTTGIEVIPSDPAWEPKVLISPFIVSPIFNYNWSTAADDTRQATTVSQYGITLLDHSGYSGPYTNLSPYLLVGSASLTAFRDLTPESALVLKDYAKNEASNYSNKVAAVIPHWYAAFAEALVGVEHNIMHPNDSYQLFLARSWIDGESASNLERYSDIPFLSQGGDLFYVHKLAETAKAYAAFGSPVPSVSPSAAPAKPGDIEGNNKVDIFDYNILLTNFGKTGSGIQGDIDGNGKVDIFDYNLLLTNFGK